MKARQIGPDCGCNLKCFEKIGMNNIRDIFKAFWAIGNYDSQNAYLHAQIRTEMIKRKRTKAEVSRRKVTYEYFVKLNRIDRRVCRQAFLSIHGITKAKLQILLQKKRESGNGTPILDKRGKFASPKAIVGPSLESVHSHIATLPVIASHYTRATTPHRRYLETGSTIKTLHCDYILWMYENRPGVPPVTQRFYQTVFTRDYNIVSQAPKTDVCTTCETLRMQIRNQKELGCDATQLQLQLEEHEKKAKVPRDLLKAAELQGKKTGQDCNIKTVAMDLQQTLPCPRLRAGAAYYKRKVWLYNFCVYDINEQEGSMFVWDEMTAGRGADEMASCLLKWIDIKMRQQGQDFTTLRVFCDNCAGQNKNHIMVLAALKLVQASVLFRVEFVFMVSGHSYLPCDRAFGNIEKKLATYAFITCPDMYKEGIRNAIGKKNPVIEMQRSDFLDVRTLLDHVTKRKAPGFSKASQIVVDGSYREGFMLKTSYEFADDPEWTHKTRIMPGKQRYSPKNFNLNDVELRPKYATARPLQKEKLDDLKSLHCLLDLPGKAWVDSVIAEQQELQEKGRQRSSDEDETDYPDNINWEYCPLQGTSNN